MNWKSIPDEPFPDTPIPHANTNPYERKHKTPGFSMTSTSTKQSYHKASLACTRKVDQSRDPAVTYPKTPPGNRNNYGPVASYASVTIPPTATTIQATNINTNPSNNINQSTTASVQAQIDQSTAIIHNEFDNKLTHVNTIMTTIQFNKKQHLQKLQQQI
jgi:hypothetical protein